MESALAYALSFIALRYFNAVGADPAGKIGKSLRPGNARDSISFERGDGELIERYYDILRPTSVTMVLPGRLRLMMPEI